MQFQPNEFSSSDEGHSCCVQWECLVVEAREDDAPKHSSEGLKSTKTNARYLSASQESTSAHTQRLSRQYHRAECL